MKYKINEIFYSIQGEGSYSGSPAIFIRFSGCNLKCDFCDTKHETGRLYTKEKIYQQIKDYAVRIIIFTGGEPTLQIDNELCLYLKEKGYRLHIETNGTNKVNNLIDFITVSPKIDKIIQTSGDEIKIINDTVNPEIFENMNFKRFYIQPKSQKNIEEVINFIKKNTKWSLSIQIQKMISIQ